MRWRYVIPNAITCLSLVFGLYGIECAMRGRVVDGCWWTLLCVGTDKLDGAAAKFLDAGSAFGVQLDSLADLVSFGVAPAALLYAFYSTRGWPELPLLILCAAWLIAAAIRLARFNVKAAQGGASFYSGTPSTMAAGMLLTAFLTVLKYSGQGNDDWRILPLHTDGIVGYLPWLLPLGAAGMLSPLRVPKIGRTRHLATTILLFSAMALGLALGLGRRMPEYLLFGGVVWLVVAISFHLRRD